MEVPIFLSRFASHRLSVALIASLLSASCAAPPPQGDQNSQSGADGRHATSSSESVAPVPKGAEELRSWIEEQNRLYKIAAPLLTVNANLCKNNARYLLGITAKTKYSYLPRFSQEAQMANGLGERLRIMEVLPGSGAARSGLKSGDILMAIEGNAFTAGPLAERNAAALANSTTLNKSVINLEVLRDGRRLSFQTPLTLACAFSIELGNSEDATSYADGYRVMVTRGLFRFTQSDNELAFVLAKEIAHSIISQSSMELRTNRRQLKSAIDNLHITRPTSAAALTVDVRPYSSLADAAADELAVYLLERAGYGTDTITEFWSRLAEKYPADVKGGHTYLHPSTAYRIEAMRQAKIDIMKKRRLGVRLRPSEVAASR